MLPLVHLMKLKTHIPRPIYFMLSLNITIITVIYRLVVPLSNGWTGDFLYYTTISGTIGASCRPVHNIIRNIFFNRQWYDILLYYKLNLYYNNIHEHCSMIYRPPRDYYPSVLWIQFNFFFFFKHIPSELLSAIRYYYQLLTVGHHCERPFIYIREDNI